MKKLIFLILLFILLVASAKAATGPEEISNISHQGSANTGKDIQ